MQQRHTEAIDMIVTTNSHVNEEKEALQRKIEELQSAMQDQEIVASVAVESLRDELEKMRRSNGYERGHEDEGLSDDDVELDDDDRDPRDDEMLNLTDSSTINDEDEMPNLDNGHDESNVSQKPNNDRAVPSKSPTPPSTPHPHYEKLLQCNTHRQHLSDALQIAREKAP